MLRSVLTSNGPWMFKTITPKWHTADNSDRKSALAVSSGKCPWEDWRTASCFPAVLGLQNRGVELFTRQETSTSKWRLHHAKQKANMMPNYSITVNIPLWKRKHHLLHYWLLNVENMISTVAKLTNQPANFGNFGLNDPRGVRRGSLVTSIEETVPCDIFEWWMVTEILHHMLWIYPSKITMTLLG